MPNCLPRRTVSPVAEARSVPHAAPVPLDSSTVGAVHELISQRWSARGYDAEATVSVDEVTEILDAGRWAPTWGRIQPVRFIAGRRGDETEHNQREQRPQQHAAANGARIRMKFRDRHDARA